MTDTVAGLTTEAVGGTVKVTDEQLDGVNAWLGQRLPGVLAALDAAGCGWQQTLLACTYLLAAVFNRHPEYFETFGQLLDAERVYYAELEAAWAAQNQHLFSEATKQDAMLVLLPFGSLPVANEQ